MSKKKSPSIEQKAHKAVSRLRIYIIIGAIALVALLLSPFVYTALALYTFDTENAFIDSMVERFSYPIAIVNGTSISYQEYKDAVARAESVTDYFNTDPAFISEIGALPDRQQIREDEMDRMIELVLLEQISEEFELTVSPEEIEAAYQTFIQGEVDSSDEEINEFLLEVYGLTLDEFKQTIVREVVLREKVTAYLVENEKSAITETAFTTITDIQAHLIDNPDGFSDSAQQYSQDGTAQLGGEMDYFTRGVMVEEFEEAAFALKEIGEISDIVETDFGYHLIQLIDRKDGDDPEVESIKVRHILIRYSVDDYLQTRLDESVIRQLIDVTQ